MQVKTDGVYDLGKGLASAITGLFLPSYVLLYNWSEGGDSLVVLQIFGLFYVFAFYSISIGGFNADATAFRIFDPNWYLDLEKYVTDASYSSDTETELAERFADLGIEMVYGNYKDFFEEGEDLALGIGGMLMAAFVVLLVLGIILNIAGQVKGSGILILIAGLAALGALMLTWMSLAGMDSVFPFFTVPGDKYIPIPFGCLLVILAGVRAVMAKPAN